MDQIAIGCSCLEKYPVEWLRKAMEKVHLSIGQL